MDTPRLEGGVRLAGVHSVDRVNVYRHLLETDREKEMQERVAKIVDEEIQQKRENERFEEVLQRERERRMNEEAQRQREQEI